LLKREDFIGRLAEKGYTKRDAAIIIDDFIETLEEALVQGESVMFRGFGTFEVREHVSREGVCPQTKARIVIPSFRAPHFTVGKLLRRRINGDDDVAEA
jgi:DNA-binding protein HU-beta